MAESKQADQGGEETAPRWVILQGRNEYATDEELLTAVEEYGRAIQAAVEHARQLEAADEASDPGDSDGKS
jgi:hypothetical protein